MYNLIQSSASGLIILRKQICSIMLQIKSHIFYWSYKHVTSGSIHPHYGNSNNLTPEISLFLLYFITLGLIYNQTCVSSRSSGRNPTTTKDYKAWTLSLSTWSGNNSTDQLFYFLLYSSESFLHLQREIHQNSILSRTFIQLMKHFTSTTCLLKGKDAFGTHRSRWSSECHANCCIQTPELLKY